MLKIGIIQERKSIPDTRVPLTPDQCKSILQQYPDISIKVEPSSTRSYQDSEYEQAGIELSDDLSDCDILMGVKEVPINHLIPNKTYFFFSHTIKKQAYNQELMQRMIEQKIRMIDYETLTFENTSRIVGFGFYAGVVGAHNGLLSYGEKTKLYQLKAAYTCISLDEMTEQYESLDWPVFRIALTGSGKVASGLLYIMKKCNFKELTPEEYLENKDSNQPVFTHLKGKSLYQHKDTGEYDRNDFHQNPEEYVCNFDQYLSNTDILMNGIFWHKKIPRLFNKTDAAKKNFNIKVIADITCDKDGSVPINYGSSTIDNPVYGIDKLTLSLTAPFTQGNQTIDIMAVDNLPNELPRDASKHFGENLITHIIPELLKKESLILNRATICKDGKLTDKYLYLSEYAYSNVR